MDVTQINKDLDAENDDLGRMLESLEAKNWLLPTASPGWTIAHQVAHLAYFDHAAAVAISDPDRFLEMRDDLKTAALDSGSAEADVDALTIGPLVSLSPPALLARWQANRKALNQAAVELTNDQRVEWYGPSMGSKSFLTARLMEAWAHGYDIATATGVSRTSSDRLAHIARLGFITRNWSYLVRQQEPPADPVSVELRSPSGSLWRYGPDDAAQSIVGPAEDFCLVVTQRLHIDDTTLAVTGPDAYDWMLKAQAFAGAPSQGPRAS